MARAWRGCGGVARRVDGLHAAAALRPRSAGRCRARGRRAASALGWCAWRCPGSPHDGHPTRAGPAIAGAGGPATARNFLAHRRSRADGAGHRATDRAHPAKRGPRRIGRRRAPRPRIPAAATRSGIFLPAGTGPRPDSTGGGRRRGNVTVGGGGAVRQGRAGPDRMRRPLRAAKARCCGGRQALRLVWPREPTRSGPLPGRGRRPSPGPWPAPLGRLPPGGWWRAIRRFMRDLNKAWKPTA